MTWKNSCAAMLRTCAPYVGVYGASGNTYSEP